MACAVQAISFGLAHLHGAPGGMKGAALAAGFGLLVGAMTSYSRSLAPAATAHTAADFVLMQSLY
jgi:membrane protease YdiL (CAAX protease family)